MRRGDSFEKGTPAPPAILLCHTSLPSQHRLSVPSAPPGASTDVRTSKTLLTNSGKYAHYGPGLVDREVRFNTTAACVEAARTGWTNRPGWLTPSLSQAGPEAERAAAYAP